MTTLRRRGDAEQIEELADAIAPSRLEAGPAELNSLARNLGARDVLYRTTMLHGYTEWSAKGPIVQVGIGRTDGRRRFVLAHECAHLALDPVLKPKSFLDCESPIVHGYEKRALDRLGESKSLATELVQRVGYERLCDSLAAEFLLPAREMRKIGRDDIDFTMLRFLADKYRVSLSMLVIRLNEFRADICLLQFEQSSPTEWIVLAATGVPSSWRGRVISYGTSRGSFRSLGNRIAAVDVHLRTGKEDYRVYGEVHAHGKGAIVMCRGRELRQPRLAETAIVSQSPSEAGPIRSGADDPTTRLDRVEGRIDSLRS